ncbi:MAG: NAD-dependent succinate-semialdehyde dehydrogenase [Gemmatimonadetes bacterium]|nr:NAD-dependent succinate-semialdehyde dehydrogenase [Gemmatimonadota bacterium]
MEFATINPANGELLRRYPFQSPASVDEALTRIAAGQRTWRRLDPAERARVLAPLAQGLRERQIHWAELMTQEMGKPFREATAEIEKCAWACEYYADHGPSFLADQAVATDASRSYVTYQPLGVVLAIMPWNFPFWQAIRAAVPALIAGNAVILKHAPSVPGCALGLAELFASAGVPDDVFVNLFITVESTAALIGDARVHAVTLTGSTRAGKAVAAAAGAAVKPCVLELGGSDPYVVLGDADVEAAVDACVTSRLINSGQSCIAAKRFIVEQPVAEAFTESVVGRMGAVRVGDPMAETTDVGPMARRDLRDHLHHQVQSSMDLGARCLLGGRVPDNPGWYYPATVLTDLTPEMPAWREELFGPVASIIPVESEEEALHVANDTAYGLGAAVFTSDAARGERIAREELQAGAAFVNAYTRSDPRLPFGGVKASGFGRELGEYGIREFTNVKTIVVEA